LTSKAQILKETAIVNIIIRNIKWHLDLVNLTFISSPKQYLYPVNILKQSNNPNGIINLMH